MISTLFEPTPPRKSRVEHTTYGNMTEARLLARLKQRCRTLERTNSNRRPEAFFAELTAVVDLGQRLLAKTSKEYDPFSE